MGEVNALARHRHGSLLLELLLLGGPVGSGGFISTRARPVVSPFEGPRIQLHCCRLAGVPPPPFRWPSVACSVARPVRTLPSVSEPVILVSVRFSSGAKLVPPTCVYELCNQS